MKHSVFAGYFLGGKKTFYFNNLFFCHKRLSVMINICKNDLLMVVLWIFGHWMGHIDKYNKKQFM